MIHDDILIGDKVVYIPHHLLTGNKEEMVKDENLGIVVNKDDQHIFVKYLGQGIKATAARDLFTLHNRDDLQKKLVFEEQFLKSTLHGH